MRKFFASLRRMLAADRAFEAVGAVVHDAIEKIIIPNLKKMAKSAKTPEDKSRYADLIAEYEKYADPRQPESKVFAERAEGVLVQLAGRYKKGGADAAEVAADIASNFYLRPNWMKSFDMPSFDPTDGPTKLRQRWGTILYNRGIDALRHLSRTVTRGPSIDDDEEKDPFESLPDTRDPESERKFVEVLTDLKDYVIRKSKTMGTRGEHVFEVFERWMGIALDRGADMVSIDHDVMTPLQREYEKMGEEISRSTIHSAFSDMKKLIVRFFEDELDVRVSDAVKKKLRMSSVDVLTYEGFRRRLASWVLGK